VQLHGDESADFCSKLLQNLKLLKKSNSSPHTGIIKAFGVDEHFNFSTLSEYENCCEYFMFDTKVKNYGGSGKSFDRGILKNYKLAKPFFISGGIDLNELRYIIANFPNLFAIDVNSKFEIKPGLKDVHKLKLLKNELSGK
jgi:phosphoribosylanthranilate isomerase